MELQNSDFSFEIEGNPTKFRVASFTGTEGISQLFRFEIYLTSESEDVDSEDVIRKPATLTIRRGDERKYVNGILSQFWWMGGSDRSTTYYAALVPVIWRLTQRYDSRIFQDLSVPEIVEEVLKDAEIASDFYNVKMLRKDYKEQKREYCVQYRESDFNFISRLMEEEGIFYYFEHHYDGQKRWHTMLLGDDPSCHRPIAGRSTVIFHEPTGEMPQEEHVFEYQYGHQILPGAVMLRDFNYERPSVDLEVSEKAEQDANLEVYEYPGEFDFFPKGTSLARVRLEEMQTRYRMGFGRSDCCRFVPGFLFTQSEHYKQNFNQKYLLLSVTHSGRQLEAGEGVQIADLEKILTQVLSTVKSPGTKGLNAGDLEKIGTQVLSRIPGLVGLIPSPLQPFLLSWQLFNSIKDLLDKLFGKSEGFVYRNEFTCIPSSTPFRPVRVTPKPIMQGPQTAIVVAPENEKLHMDELGRAKVKFHWDREKREKKDDDKRTCYIRVAYNYAGEDHGFQFHPLAGDEVVVDFIDGDPDKPLIVGTVYNGGNRPPLKPENKIENIILTPYQHQLLLSDRESSIRLKTGGNEVIEMIDDKENSEYGKQIKVSTADDHHIHLGKGTKGNGIGIKTEKGHLIVLSDKVDADAIYLREREKLLSIELDTPTRRITVKNESDQEILIDCQKGQVTVIGGGVAVAGGEVMITGSGAVKINSSGQVTIQAPQIKLEAASIDLNSPIVNCSGLLKCVVLETPTVIAASYTPGVGNIK